jgi:hypothetical protein
VHVAPAGRGQKRSRDTQPPVGSKGDVKVPQNLLQLVPAKYRYAFQVGDSADEIEKWRAARRKRYPSAASRAALQATVEDRLRRGEILPQADTGRMHRRIQSDTASSSAGVAAPPPHASKGLVDYSSDSSGGSPEEKPSTGQTAQLTVLDAMPRESNSQSSAGAEVSRITSGAVGDQPGSTPHKAAELEAVKQPGSRPYPPRESRSQGKVKGGHHLTASAVGSRAGTQRDAARGQRTQRHRGKQQRISLLRQLLAGEMRKENSAILQCIRYLRKESYLSDIPLHGVAAGSSSSSSEESEGSSSSGSESDP